MGTVFISYSHQDEVWKKRLEPHLKALEIQGFLQSWNDEDIQIGSDWFQAIETALNEADAVIMLISADFLASKFINEFEIPLILKRQKEENITVIPVLVKSCGWQNIKWLAAIQCLPKGGGTIAAKQGDDIEAALADVAQTVFDAIGSLPPPLLSSDNISLDRLPATGAHLFGRENELKLLDEAWADTHTHIFSLVAWGGVGKTALVNQWLNEMDRDNYRGAEKIFGWSFYSQGATEGKQVSADEFFMETLLWFGETDPQAGSAVDKGRRLARLVRQHKFLLILDGLEPMQYPPNEVKGLDGKLKDQGLAALLKELAVGGCSKGGLCVITTREPITDLKQRVNYGHQEILLEHLSTEAGVLLLKSLGVTLGAPLDFQKAVTEYEGHALALTLLGLYIKRAFEGDVRRRDEIPGLAKERHKGFHAQQVMDAYEKWYTKYPKWNFLRRFKGFCSPTPELNILYIMGLFDRPVAQEVIEELLKEPVIPGVTDHLVGIAPEQWQYALSHLREARLLGAEQGLKKGTLDCHPLVREHFGAKLCATNPEGWQQAHLRLYHYFKQKPKKKLPNRLMKMEPLFAAVAHGCKAGLHQEVLVKVFLKRMLRGEKLHLIHKLGAYGSYLTALSFFFALPWSQPVAGLTEDARVLVLDCALLGLREVGRLQEAIQPLKAALELRIQQENWGNAATKASNLSELLLTMGDVPGAVVLARQSVAHADHSENEVMKEYSRTTLADALHWSGAKTEAEKWFREAEAKQKQRQPEFPFLHSVQGYQFCDLLLENQSLAQVNEVIIRAEKALEIDLNGSQSLLSIALNKLTLGRAWMKIPSLAKAKTFLEEAVAGMREAGSQEFIGCGLLARAEYYRFMKEYAKAHDDLDEVRDIAEWRDIKPFLCEYHLEKRELCLEEGKTDEAEEHEKKAEALIKETGYGRKRLSKNC